MWESLATGASEDVATDGRNVGRGRSRVADVSMGFRCDETTELTAGYVRRQIGLRTTLPGLLRIVLSRTGAENTSAINRIRSASGTAFPIDDTLDAPRVSLMEDALELAFSASGTLKDT